MKVASYGRIINAFGVLKISPAGRPFQLSTFNLELLTYILMVEERKKF